MANTCKYYKQQKQVSYNQGQTWSSLNEFRMGALYESDSEDCGAVIIMYRWINLNPSTDYYCSGTTKYYKQQKQVSYDEGMTWENVSPAEYQWGGIAEAQSVDCGYVPPTPTGNTKLYAVYSDSSTYILECDSSSELTSGDTRPSGYKTSAMTSAEIGDCVTTIGQFAFQVCSSLTSITIPNSVISISGYSFDRCFSLTSITIPNSVTSIGNYAFSHCRSLSSCTIGNGVTSIGVNAFGNCRSLTSVVIPNSVTSIGEQAFDECYALTSVTIPNSITYIAPDTFAYCRSLTNITIPESVTSIDYFAFNRCSGLTSVTIPSGVTYIGKGAFFGCSGLTNVTVNAVIPPTIGSGVNGPFDETNNCPIYVPCESVNAYKSASGWSSYASRIEGIPPCGEPSFNGKFKANYSNGTSYSAACDSSSELTSGETRPNGYAASAMTSAEVGSCVTSIGAGAFTRCSGLTSVDIPNSVTSIDNYGFYHCNSLTRLNSKINGVFNIPNGLTSIGDRFFWGCSGMTSCTIHNGITSIGNNAFYACSGLTSITIPSGVTSIGNEAFSHCTALTSITIPNGVTSIGNYTFAFCSSLTGNLTIPSGITTLNEAVFRGCSSLTTVTIPSGITAIEYMAFYNCTSLTSITCLATTPPSLAPSISPTYSNEVFTNTNDCPIYVPATSVNTYKSASGWSDYASRIQAIT